MNMSSIWVRCFLLFFLGGTILVGCQSPSVGMPSSSGQLRALAERTQPQLSDATRGALLYVATGDNVYILSYPKGSLVSSLGIPGNNLCSDKTGDVFVPTTAYQIAEYSHRGKLLKVLQDGDTPLGCAVDPKTGNLAVTNEGSGAGEVAIYPQAKEPAQWYRDAEINTFGLCGYDDHGNLFVDGIGRSGVFAELPAGRGSFTNYTLSSKFDALGSIQWDGRYVTLSNPTAHVIYRLKLGHSLKVVGTTHVHGWHNVYYGHWPYVQTWIAGTTFIAQAGTQVKVGLWAYPRGGRPSEVLRPFRHGGVNIYGVSLSLAP